MEVGAPRGTSSIARKGTKIIDLVRAHRSLGSPDELVAQRRALYRLAAELLSLEGLLVHDTSSLPEDSFDDPIIRLSIGLNMARAHQHTSGAQPIFDLPEPLAHDDVLLAEPSRLPKIRLIATPRGAAHVSPTLRILERHMSLQGQPAQGLHLIEDWRSPRSQEILATVLEGLQLLDDLVEPLAFDLLSNSFLVAVIPQTQRAPMSASLREAPGIIFIREPRVSLDAAEALLHEAAHQRFFDYVLLREMIIGDTSSRWQPPWRPPGTEWNLERMMAAAHTYACLTHLKNRLGRTRPDSKPSGGSLLDEARDRVGILLDAILSRVNETGSDAAQFFALLSGSDISVEPPYEASATRRWGELRGGVFRSAPGLHIRTQPGWSRSLVGRRGRPPELFWLDDGAAHILNIAARKAVTEAEIQRSFSSRFGISAAATQDAIAPRLLILLRDSLVLRVEQV